MSTYSWGANLTNNFPYELLSHSLIVNCHINISIHKNKANLGEFCHGVSGVCD